MFESGGRAADAAALGPMLDRIGHRGPDHRGVWADGGCALGHLRLSILDPSERGHQPFVSPDGLGVLVYGGEVYNFRELRLELEADGIAFTSGTDTEVVLHALRRWGPEAAVARFDGMFAFAYLDCERDRLWLGRDRLGIKPLYVARPPGRFVFASEPKALLAHPDVTARPNAAMLARHIASQLPHHEERHTAFEGIEAVVPGTLLEVAAGECRETVWFDLAGSLDVERIVRAGRAGAETLLDGFERALHESVRMHLVSDVPLATTCSGGVDSSLVTASIHRNLPGVVAYVANVEGTAQEGPKALKVGRHLGIDVRVVDVAHADFLGMWPDATWFSDQPLSIGPSIPLLAVARACRADGVKVLLSGEGSDELFGGYPWQAQSHLRWRAWRRRTQLRSAFRWLGPLGRRLFPAAYPPERELLRDPLGRLPPTAGARAQLELRSLLPFAQIESDRALMERLAPVQPPEARAFLAHSLSDTRFFLQAMLLHADRMCMAAGVEMRVPFVENRVIDVAAHAPLEAKYSRGRQKWLVKRAAERLLPHEIVHQPKMHFAVPYQKFARAISLLDGGFVAELLGWSPGTARELMPLVAHYPLLAQRLVGTEIWGRVFLRGVAPAELGERLAES